MLEIQFLFRFPFNTLHTLHRKSFAEMQGSFSFVKEVTDRCLQQNKKSSYRI